MDEGNVMKFHEHFELAQDSKCRLPDAEIIHNGTRVKSILSTHCEFDQSKYLRMFGESFPDIKGDQLKALKDVCLEAYRSERLNFLIDINATNQWLRTVIGHKDLCSEKWTEANSDLISKIVIHSNIVPYDPYWTKRVAQRVRSNVMRVHFPSCVLKEALDEEKSLATKLHEWMTCSGEECEIGMHKREQLRTKFWEIPKDEVDLVKELAKECDIWLVTWKGGRFVQKGTKGNHDEFKVVLTLSHPHIVYSFGELCGGTGSSTYFMEYMSNDLCSFIIDRKRTVGGNRPPFSPYESVDVLLQIAKAMEYMHGEDVVHCDLKAMNVLISEIAVSETLKHYLVKVADFGSARAGRSGSEVIGFIAGPGTTPYMAPEALRQQKQLRGLQAKELEHDKLMDKAKHISFPRKIDVYSFGIVAFEVLTGYIYNIDSSYCSSSSQFKVGVIGGTKRPLLRQGCQRAKEFVQDEKLILLIESCWHPDPSQRPSFEKICEELNEARDRLSEVPSESSFGALFRRFLHWLCSLLRRS